MSDAAQTLAGTKVWVCAPDGPPEARAAVLAEMFAQQRSLPEASPGAVDRAMKARGLWGIRRSKGVRTTIPGKDGKRAGDLLNRDFTACAPNRTWVMDFTYCRTWAGFAYVAQPFLY